MSTSGLGKTYSNGEAIVRQGETGDCMFAVQQGRLDAGALPLLTLLALSAFVPLWEVAQVGRQLADTLGAARRLHAVESEPVPVVDMRLKFGMSRTEQTLNTCIIIVEINIDGDRLILGALADSVQEVIELGPGQIEPAPRIGTRLDTEFIKGMGKRDEEFIIILDIDRIFSMDELASVGVAEAC